jgi:uncharacterized protein (TIGR00369 family)
MTAAMDQRNGRLSFGPMHDTEIVPDTDDAPPPGFERMPTFGPFHQFAGPTYWRQADGCMTVGLRVQDKHRNRGPMMHGGMVCMLADTASHWAARHSRELPGMMLTTGLNVSLMGNAAPGEWVEARVEVLRAGRSIVFTNCLISCNGRTIAQASAQFQVVAESAAAGPPK